jgi:TatA/E family protein of Tat protein translocase
MEFFGMGPLEILLILIVGLIAFGPGRLPQLARNLGKGIAAFKKAAFELTAEVSKEFEEIKKEDDELQDRNEQPKDETGKAAKHDAGKSAR